MAVQEPSLDLNHKVHMMRLSSPDCLSRELQSSAYDHEGNAVWESMKHSSSDCEVTAMYTAATVLLQLEGEQVNTLTMLTANLPILSATELNTRFSETWTALTTLSFVNVFSVYTWIKLLGEGVFPKLRTLMLAHTDMEVEDLAESLIAHKEFHRPPLDLYLLRGSSWMHKNEIYYYTSVDQTNKPKDLFEWSIIYGVAGSVHWLVCEYNVLSTHCYTQILAGLAEDDMLADSDEL